MFPVTNLKLSAPSVCDPLLTLTLSVVFSWRPCCYTKLMKHCYGASVTVYAVKTAACTQMYLLT